MTDFERFPDVMDQAQQITERHQADALARFRRQNQPEQVQREDGSWPTVECVDCGDDLIPERLNLGKIRCVLCQGIKEKRENGKG